MFNLKEYYVQHYDSNTEGKYIYIFLRVLHTDSTPHTRSLVSLSAEVTSSQITYLFSFYIRSFFKEIHVF